MSNALNIEIGMRIKEVRCKKGLTRNEVSERAYITSQFLGLVETGIKGLSTESLRNVARALNVTTDYLLFGLTDTERRLDLATQALASFTDEERENIYAILDKTIEILRKTK